MAKRQPSRRPPNFLIYRGQSFRAEWYYTTDGEMPALDYYNNLPAVDQERLDDMIQYFCDRPFGVILPTSMYKIEDPENKIYAFRPRNERFFNFAAEGAVVVITNAYHKHSQQMTKMDLGKLALAAKYREDYLQRVKEATYYGHPEN